MPKYKALVFKTEYSSRWVTFEAESEDEAWEWKAEAEAEKIKNWSGDAPEYEVDSIEEIKDDE